MLGGGVDAATLVSALCAGPPPPEDPLAPTALPPGPCVARNDGRATVQSWRELGKVVKYRRGGGHPQPER